MPALIATQFTRDPETSHMSSVLGALMPASRMQALPANDPDGVEPTSIDRSRVGRRRLTTEELKAGEMAAANARLREQIGERIREARRARNWSQAEAARMFGCASSTQVSLWESGQRMPPHDQLVNVARVLECSLDYLFGLSGDPDIDLVGSARRRLSDVVQRTLEKTAEIVTVQVERHVRLLGSTQSDVRSLLATGDALLNAAHDLIRLNPQAFDGLRGGATLVRCACDFEAQADDARRTLRLNDALDGDLRHALNGLRDAEPALPGGAGGLN